MKSISYERGGLFDVGIAVVRQYDRLLACIDAVRGGTVQPGRILVVDNGGDFCRVGNNRGVQVVRPNRNLGCAGAWNLMLKLIHPSIAIILNDDCIVAPDTLEKMLAVEGPALVNGHGWGCFRQDKEITEQVGFYDEALWPVYFEDADMDQRMRIAGAKRVDLGAHDSQRGICLSHGNHGEHPYQHWTTEQKADFQVCYEKNKAYFLEKWGADPDELAKRRVASPAGLVTAGAPAETGMNGPSGPVGISLRVPMRPKISVMIHSASPDNFLAHHGIPSAWAMVVADLERQDFRDFELVAVDRWRDGQPDLFERLKPSFPVKHVAVHPAHRYWYDKGYCWISAAKNTGILFADGELLITVDDGAVWNTNDFLTKYWDYYQRGRYLNAAICHWDDVKVANGLPLYPLRGKQTMDDVGRQYSGHVLEHDHGNWLFTGSSFPLEHALNVNGFSERCDGTKSLEDCEFGIRLQKTGGKFVMDRSVFCHILSHPPIHGWDDKGEADGGKKKRPCPASPLGIRSLVAIENYANISFVEELGEYEANKHPITHRHLDIIRRDTLRFRDFDPLVPERAEAMKLWLWTPTFSLRAEREELRRSPTWRW